MIKNKFSPNARFLIAGFTAVLFLRAFGVVALFQHSPNADGFAVDKHYAKRVFYFKKDLPSDEVFFDQSPEKNYLEFERIRPTKIFFLSDCDLTTRLLRSPPAFL